MNVLWVSHFVPWPPKGGNLQRSYHLIRALTEIATIDLVTFHRRGSLAEADLDGARRALLGLCRDVEIFPIPNERSRLRFAAGLARNLVQADPYTVAELRSVSFRETLARWVEGRPYDAVHFDTIDLAPHHTETGALPAVLNHHNVESLLFERRAPYEKSRLAGAYLAVQARKLRRTERRWYGAFDRNLFVSAADRERAAADCPGLRGSVVPNGVDVDYYRPGDEGSDERVVWVGGLGWFPNRDAVDHLVSDVWPLVRRRRPSARLDIIGSAPERFRPSPKEAGVTYHGFVDDLRPLTQAAKVFVVPIRVGGGTRLKILDAMAMGKAIVTTTIGCEGIDPSPGEEMVLADTPEAFAAAVVELLHDAARRRRLGEAARSLAERRFAWSVVGEGFRGVYRGLARERAAVRRERPTDA